MFGALALLALAGAGQAAERCSATARDIAAGEPLAAEALVRVPCRANDRPEGRIAFDTASQATIAAAPLPAGTYLGRIWADAAPVLPKGTRLTLRAIAGPARVERDVTTLQPARSGQRVFVRDSSGAIFSVLLSLAGAEVPTP